ncbi:DUF4278 domain-containing protein [Leptolyngbya sp. PCC 6406]|uniref:arginine synthesis PII-interacting regulator PirA n=1 Tax=Leptolyngbya sp. PCC 6406 TaxID=1173264 RepID=UPI0002AC1505|nr:DUF4278 domain-containing protein [Leptolyngbya sp. PCC 6406]
MKLCYRGVEYDYTPPVLEVTESEVLGCYRGRPCNFSYVRHIPFPQPVAAMKFRGHAYQTNSHGSLEPLAQMPEAEVVPPTPAYRSMTQARRQLLKEATRIHQDNIRRSLEHRMAIARSQGNDGLLHQLEEELHQFA